MSYEKKIKEQNIKVYQLFNGKNYASKYVMIFRGPSSSHFNEENKHIKLILVPSYNIPNTY
jgi:hypothetical protein